MKQSELIQESKAIRLRTFKGKSKAVIDAKWLLLGGNKQPYLSIDIVNVTIDGACIDGHQEKIKALKTLDNDFYLLAKHHLGRLNGEAMHYYANAHYFYDTTRKHIFDKPSISSEVEKEIRELKEGCINDLLELIRKEVCNRYDYKSKDILSERNFKEYLSRIEKDLEVLYHTRESRLDHMQECLGLSPKGVVKFNAWRKQYHKTKKELNRLDKLETIREDELWTVDRLAEHLGLVKETVQGLLLKSLTQEELAVYLEPLADAAALEPEELTKHYSIPLVVTK